MTRKTTPMESAPFAWVTFSAFLAGRYKNLALYPLTPYNALH